MDSAGDKYNFLTLINYVGKTKQRKSTWLCLCDCGNKKIMVLSRLKSGNTKSCGCIKSKAISDSKYKHGRNQKDRTYNSWAAMKDRCKRRPYYIKKGVSVCDEWKNDFLQFLFDMGERPKNKTLDRKDNSKGYFKENCRWATNKEQMENTDRNRIIEFNGKSMIISKWGKELGLNSGVINKRIKRGWSIEKALQNSN